MKTTLKLIALVIAAATPLFAAAEIAGVPSPSGEALLALFVAAALLALVIRDYTPRRMVALPAASQRRLLRETAVKQLGSRGSFERPLAA